MKSSIKLLLWRLYLLHNNVIEYIKQIIFRKYKNVENHIKQMMLYFTYFDCI